MKVIYLHGYGSTGESSKTQLLRKELGDDVVVAPTLPADPNEIERIVNNIVRTNKSYPLVFVGTSLGGFWANYFAQKWDARCVIVNPVVLGSVVIQKYIDNPIPNYTTGEQIVLLPAYVTEYEKREKYLSENTNGSLINMFIAKDDNLVNPLAVIKHIPYVASCVIKTDGGHRFEKHWLEVVNKVKACSL